MKRFKDIQKQFIQPGYTVDRNDHLQDVTVRGYQLMVHASEIYSQAFADYTDGTVMPAGYGAVTAQRVWTPGDQKKHAYMSR